MSDNNILNFIPLKKPPAEEVIQLRPGRVYRLTSAQQEDILIEDEWVRIGNRALSRSPTNLVS